MVNGFVLVPKNKDKDVQDISYIAEKCFIRARYALVTNQNQQKYADYFAIIDELERSYKPF